MADQPKLRFMCVVSENGQIFIPVKMREVSDIKPKDVVRFEYEADGRIIFSKDKEASEAEQGTKEKEQKDGKKREESRM